LHGGYVGTLFRRSDVDSFLLFLTSWFTIWKCFVEACGIQWIASLGMYYSTVTSQNQSSLDDCMAACVDSPDCIGVDWNSTSGNVVQTTAAGDARGRPCSLLKAAVYTTRYTIDDAMSHYDIIRNTACKGRLSQKND